MGVGVQLGPGREGPQLQTQAGLRFDLSTASAPSAAAAAAPLDALAARPLLASWNSPGWEGRASVFSAAPGGEGRSALCPTSSPQQGGDTAHRPRSRACWAVAPPPQARPSRAQTWGPGWPSGPRPGWPGPGARAERQKPRPPPPPTEGPAGLGEWAPMGEGLQWGRGSSGGVGSNGGVGRVGAAGARRAALLSRTQRIRNRLALCPRAAPPRPPHPPPTCAPTALSCRPRKASGPWTPQPHRSGVLALCPLLPSAPRFRGVGDSPHQPPQARERVLRAESLGSRGWLPAGAPRGGNCGRRAGLGPHRRGRCRPRALPLGWGRSPLLPSVPVAQRTKPLMGS